MRKDLDKYRIWCNTEGKWVRSWAEEEPTVCPNNIGHSINTNKTAIVSKKLDMKPVDRSGKQRVHETSRKIGTKVYWTGAGDDPSNPDNVGGGNTFTFSHVSGSPSHEEYYFDFNIIENETWIHEGYVTWKDCIFDRVSLEIVPRVTPTSASSNTLYNVYGGFLIIPAAGDGVIDVDTISAGTMPSTGGLIYIPEDDEGNQPPSYWNADWNTTTNQFENITAAPAGNGQYNMYSVEVPISRFVNNMPFLDSGFIRIQSADVDEIGHGMRFKVICNTHTEDVGDHNWYTAITLTMNRVKQL